MSHELPPSPSFDEAVAALNFDAEVHRLVIVNPDARRVHQSLSDLYGAARSDLVSRGLVPVTRHDNNRQVIQHCDALAESLTKVGAVIEWMVEKAYHDLSEVGAFVEKPAEPVRPMEFPPPEDPIPPAEGETNPEGPAQVEPDPPKDETIAPEGEPTGATDETPAVAEGESTGPEDEAAATQAETPPEPEPAGEPEPPAPPSTNRGRKGK